MPVKKIFLETVAWPAGTLGLFIAYPGRANAQSCQSVALQHKCNGLILIEIFFKLLKYIIGNRDL